MFISGVAKVNRAKISAIMQSTVIEDLGDLQIIFLLLKSRAS
jgi:hypothetical protein